MKSKVSKEFKEEVNSNIAKASYVSSRLGVRLFIGGAILVFGLGAVGLVYTGTIGKAQKNIERQVFKKSISYTEGAAGFLADSYRQYNEAEDQEAAAMIKEYVIDKYPNLDVNAIDNLKLRAFYEECQMGGN